MAVSKTILVVAVVAVVAVAGVAAFLLMNNGGSSDDPIDFSPTTRMMVYGNANNDDYLDKSDVNYIQDIIDGKIVWNRTTHPLADATCDGAITSADVDLVNKFLKGESATMNYMNWYGQKRSISYPLSGNIAGSYVEIAGVAWIAGCYNDITSMRDTQEHLDGLDSVQYPGAAGKWKTVSDDTNKTFDIQRLLAQKVKVILTDPDFLANGLDDKIRAADKSINIIELPINRAVKDVDWTHTIVTLGAMYNHQSATKDYIKFVQDVEKDIKDQMDTVKKKYPDQTFLICYEPTNATVTCLDIFGTGSVQYGDVVNMVRLPLTCAVDPMGPSGWVEDYKIEDVITKNPTVIVIESWGKLNSMSESEYRKTMETWVSYFEKTGAYKNNKVVTIAYEVYGTVPGIAGMIYMGSLIWPDLFDADKGIEYLNYYYQNFTPMGKSFDVTKNYGFLPEQWGASIN